MAIPHQEKLFNDCVHGHIVLPRLCVSIIDTKIFQRLRSIKQLGFGYFVFPGASHNRFEHSLGVCHLAGEMVDALNKNWMASEPESFAPIRAKEKLCIQVAGLCHDIGHGPYSHTWEHFMRDRMRETSFKHEIMSVKLFDELCKEEKVRAELNSSGISDDDCKFIKSLILGTPLENGNNQKPYLYEIVSNSANGIDVDKWDYLLRDGKQLNINITFDPQRLLRFSRIAEYRGQKHICIRDKERSNIFQMYMMRAELHRVAYQHPVVKIIEEMWLDAIEKAVKEQYVFHGLKLNEVHSDPKVFVKLTDHIFQDILSSSGSFDIPRRILERIQERNLYKIVGKIVLDSDVERVWEKIQESIALHDDVISATKVKVEVPGKKLTENVFLYSKKDINNARPYNDWSQVPVIPIAFGEELERCEVIFYTKSERLEEEVEAKNIARQIISGISPSWK